MILTLILILMLLVVYISNRYTRKLKSNIIIIKIFGGNNYEKFKSAKCV